MSEPTDAERCTGCGEPIAPADRFCQRCGRSLASGHEGLGWSDVGRSGRVPAERSRWLAVALPIAGLVAIGAAVVLVLILNRNHSPVASSTPISSPSSQDPGPNTAVTSPPSASTPDVTDADPSTSLAPRPWNSVSVARAPSTSTDSVDGAGNRTSFVAANMLDGNPVTAWRMDGDGTGAVLTFGLDDLRPIAQLGLVNGYAKIDPATGEDRYTQGRRVVTVSWSVDRQVYHQRLVDGARCLQVFNIPPVRARIVQLRIDGVTEPGDARFDKTAISDVLIAG